jgi:hypothetical protein
MITQREYVEGCLQWYREADFQPGNPEDGEWHECHYPVPKCLKGTETILLLKEHHAVQGVLQSEEYQTCCVYNWERHFLSGELLLIYRKWRSTHTKKNTKKWLESTTPEQRSLKEKEKWAKYPSHKKESRLQGLKEYNQRTSKPVILTDQHGVERSYPSVTAASRDLNLKDSSIANVAKGRAKTVGGFTARYAD